MPRGGDDIGDLEDILLEEVYLADDSGEVELDLEIDPETGARSWRRSGDGALHHPTEPALVLPDGTREWYLEGDLCSINGAPSRILPDGTREWHKDGLLESPDGAPSRILPDGTREWHKDGLLESPDGGPSRILPDGTIQRHQGGVLSVIHDQPSVVLPDGTLRWEEDTSTFPYSRNPDGSFGVLHRAGAPAIVCPTQEAQANNGGLVKAYYNGGALMRRSTEGHFLNMPEEPCQVWAGDDPRLVFCEGHADGISGYYYYVIHADGREYLIEEDGFIIQEATAEGEIVEQDWHKKPYRAEMAAETRILFEQSHSRKRNLSELKNPTTK